ncbi:SRPBCC family protein [Nonomuraea sp. NPDC003804]|uniref:SRPBCC family protein n=1 Tax=Nonomuraea sp. NPDC003804 TaxID=3154547 RepID=UPI0033B4F401
MSRHEHHRTDKLARTLGWVSLGLGATHLLAPDAVRRVSGIDGSPSAKAATKAAGARELVQAALLLGSRRPARWAWTRVAGDALDLALLGKAMTTRSGDDRRRLAAATAAVGGITALDLFTTLNGLRSGREPLSIHASITVNRPRDLVYRFCRDLDNLPRFMTHLESVQPLDERRSRWQGKGPTADLSWVAEIVEDRVGELIAWTSPGRSVTASGSARFADGPAGRGTVVEYTLRYGRPGRALGAAVARMLGEHPEQRIRDDLRRLKQILETGEVLRSEGSPEGTHAPRQRRQRPAQPVGGRA